MPDKYPRVVLRLSEEKRQEWHKYAKDSGFETLSAYIKFLVFTDMKKSREGKKTK